MVDEGSSCVAVVSNSQDRNLGRLVTSSKTSCLSSIQCDLGESGKGISEQQSFMFSSHPNFILFHLQSSYMFVCLVKMWTMVAWMTLAYSMKVAIVHETKVAINHVNEP